MAAADTPPTTTTPTDPDTWADGISRELLAVHAQQRKLPATERVAMVEEFVRRQIAPVAAKERQKYLRALSARFPLSTLAQPNHRESAAPAGPPTGEQWLEGFDAIKDELTDAQKAALLEKLRHAGFIPATPPAAVAGISAPPALITLVGKDSLDLERASQLVETTFDATRMLDSSFRRVWAGLAEYGKTEAGLPRESLDEIMRRYLAGDPDVPKVVLKTRMEATTKLIPLVIIALKEAWDSMQKQVANCLPEEIQSRVKKGWGYESDCWKEYVRGAVELQSERRDRAFFALVVDRALKTMMK